MLVTVLGMSVPLHPTTNVLIDVSIIALQLPRELYFGFSPFKVIASNLTQSLKAS